MIKLGNALFIAVLCTLLGCASSSVQRGALIGAAAGAATGAGVGVLVSDDDLLGSGSSKLKGDTSLDAGSAIAASVAIGTVFGGIVGAMVGHQREQSPAEQALSGEQAKTAGPTAF